MTIIRKDTFTCYFINSNTEKRFQSLVEAQRLLLIIVVAVDIQDYFQVKTLIYMVLVMEQLA